MNNLSSLVKYRSFYAILIGFWFVLSFFYIQHTPAHIRTHDFWEHLEYTQIIVTEHRLPKPQEKWETYHPPFYYLLNSFIFPSSFDEDFVKFRNSDVPHVKWVDFLSVVYGTLTLILLSLFLQKYSKDLKINLLVLLFICSTPKFVYIFTTYNNDSLSALFCVYAMYLVWELHEKWSIKNAFILFIVSSLCFYTKYIIVLPMACVFFVFLLKSITQKSKPTVNEIKIIIVFALSFMTLIPWLYFHNYKHTKKFLPTNFDNKINTDLSLSQALIVLDSVIDIPFIRSDRSGLEVEKWEDPWSHVYLYEYQNGTKQHDYFMYILVTSIYGEFMFDQKYVQYFWLLLFIHLMLLIIIFIRFIKYREPLVLLSMIFLLLSYLTHILTIIRMTKPVYGCALDYRYIVWNLPAFAILLSSILYSANNYKVNSIVRYILYVGILLHIFVLLVVP